jgi:hypothetical protein
LAGAAKVGNAGCTGSIAISRWMSPLGRPRPRLYAAGAKHHDLKRSLLGLEPGIRCASPQRLLAVKTNSGPFGQLRCLRQNVSFWSDTAAGKTFSVLEGF